MVETRYVARPLTGGLDTETPQTAISPDSSPDLGNVLLHNKSVDKRPGFTPLVREQPRLNGVRNRGHHGVSREGGVIGLGNTDFLIVPGHMVAGHRRIYETQPAVTLEIRALVVEDLTLEHTGNGDSLNAPYTIKVRPIISKGPLKKTGDTVTTQYSPGGATISWKTTNVWGAGANSGLPFAIYLWNNAGTWEWRLSFHTFNVNWILQTVTNTAPVELGGEYHVIATIDDASKTARLRIGRRRRGEATVYTHASISFAGETYTEGNLCPIQVFDCPQQLVDATAVGTPVVRPGLGLGAAADGGYFFAAKRFEGTVEDIVVYGSDKLSASITALDGDGKIDVASGTDILNAWTMDREGDRFIAEVTGRGNHLYFAPSGPIHDGVSGGPRGGASWWFNGLTSYAMVDLEEGQAAFNPNWRTYAVAGATQRAWMAAILKANPMYTHGIEVCFWADSIEPQFEQVLMEIPGALRLAIDVDGTLVGYCRDDSVAIIHPLGGATYQAAFVRSTTVCQPGQRYTVSLVRRDPGTTLSLSINGEVDATAAVLVGAVPVEGVSEPGGIILGMGSLENMIRDPAKAGTPNDLNTDSRSGFAGRIEQARIICSDENQTPVYKDAEAEDREFQQAQLWQSPAGSPPPDRFHIEPTDPNDFVANRDPGIALEIGKDRQRGKPVRYLVTVDNGTSYSTSTISNLGEGGHEELERVRIHTWFVLAEWILNQDDRDLAYAGSYLAGIESRYSAANAVEQNFFRSVHVQASAVTDELGVLGPLFKRCIESDTISESYTAGQGVLATSHRMRPYDFRSPVELAATWCVGCLAPLAETNPITLLADWQHEESGERFLNAACGRQLYWVKPIWKRASPFEGEHDVSALWLGGQPGDHVRIASSETEQETTGTGSRTTVVWEAWIHPYRLDGSRVLVVKGDPALQRVNFAIALEEGAIELLGTVGGNTAAWRFREGTYVGDTILRTQSIKVNAWNHVHVTLKTAGPEVRVNGELVPLVDSSVDSVPATTDSFTAGTADTGPYPMFLGGLPDGRTSLTFNATPGSFTNRYRSFHGLLTEMRQRNAEDTTSWPAGQSGLPPRVRYGDDANTFYLLHFSEGEGWAFLNAAAAAAVDDGRAAISEMVLIVEGLAESRDHRYDSVVFRDRLFLTNGESRPQRIRFTRFSDPEGPFRVEQVGMLPPFAHAVVVALVNTGVGAQIAAGLYLVHMAFVNADLTESDPVLLGEVTAAAATSYGIRVSNLPRSPDPQVVGRKLWVSATGGGPALENVVTSDNDSSDIELSPFDSLGLGVPEAGLKLPAERARHLTVGQFSLILADLVDIPAGQNSFQKSQSQEPTYFTAEAIVAIDSGDGKPVISLRGQFGATFISKRDSIWTADFRAIDITNPSERGVYGVNTSIGVGGGDVAYDNVIYGAGDKGVHLFQGTNVVYVSEALESDWASVVDRSDEGLVAMFGAYYWPNSQYWLSVRQKGTRYNERIYVLQADSQRPAWVRLIVPRHTYMTSRLRGDNQDPQLLLGGISGQVLRLSDEGAGVFIDGHDDRPNDLGAVDLDGTATGGSTTTLVMAGANFDTIGAGLRGIVIEVTHANGSIEQRAIESNTATTIRWRQPMATSVAAGAAFVIGGYEGYWSSGWIAPQDYGMAMRVTKLDLDYLPQPVLLTIESRTAVGSGITERQWDPAAPIEIATEQMSTGWQEDPVIINQQNRGRYFRARFSTKGIRTPFSIVGWGFRWMPEGIRGARI